MNNRCVWLHLNSLSRVDNAIIENPSAKVIFVFDASSLRENPLAFHRLDFVYQSVLETFAEIPNKIKEIQLGETTTEILDFCREHNCTEIHVTENPEPQFQDWLSELRKHLIIKTYKRDELSEYTDEPRRFSRYWEKTSEQVLGYPARQNRKMR